MGANQAGSACGQAAACEAEREADGEAAIHQPVDAGVVGIVRGGRCGVKAVSRRCLGGSKRVLAQQRSPRHNGCEIAEGHRWVGDGKRDAG